ncbi:hypothetical protein [Stutzerimonas kunmingensis]|uniref:hypothetical protein n=1 Tax=Stutzerimonas kunmingensis TaxID=1211807 RepID=UPI0028B06591|nr:hypothetical protein [Stutzerimonas kunmingensis]
MPHRLLALFFVLLFSSAFAQADGYFATRFDGTGKWSGATPTAAATSACTQLYPPDSPWTMASASTNPYPLFECRMGAVSGWTVPGRVWVYKQCNDQAKTAVPYNDACPISGNSGQACQGDSPALSPFGHITNADGECVDYTRADVPSQCKSLSGTSVVHNLYVNFDSDGNPETPPPINAGGCEAVAATVGHCKMAPVRVFPTGGSIQPTTNKCKVAVSFTGKTTGSAPVSPPMSTSPDTNGVCPAGHTCPDVPDAPAANDTKPCTYTEDGEGRRVCESSNFDYKPGQSSCGMVNGEFRCIGKAPTTNGISIATVVTDKTNADGSKTSTKKDVATQVVCNSPKPCVTHVTTNTTTTTYNSNGAKTGQSTTCTGPACATDGKGDLDRDGLSDCAIGKGCTEGNEPGEVGDMPNLEDASDYGDSLSGYYQRLTNAPIVRSVSSLTVPEGGSCSGSSVTIEYIGTINTSAFCDLLNTLLAPLRYVFMAIWAWAAIRTFLTA